MAHQLLGPRPVTATRLHCNQPCGDVRPTYLPPKLLPHVEPLEKYASTGHSEKDLEHLMDACDLRPDVVLLVDLDECRTLSR